MASEAIDRVREDLRRLGLEAHLVADEVTLAGHRIDSAINPSGRITAEQRALHDVGRDARQAGEQAAEARTGFATFISELDRVDLKSDETVRDLHRIGDAASRAATESAIAGRIMAAGAPGRVRGGGRGLEAMGAGALAGDVGRASGAMREADRATKDLSKDLNGLDKSSSDAGGGLGEVLSGLTGMGGKAGESSGMIRKLGLGLTGLAGPMAGLLALAPGLIFGGLAAGAVKWKSSIDLAISQNKKLTAIQQAALPTLNAVTAALGPLRTASRNAGLSLLQSFQKIIPTFRQVTPALSQMVGILGKSLNSIVTQGLPSLAGAVQKSMPAVQALGSGLSGTVNSLFKTISQLNFGQAAVGLQMLFKLVEGLLPDISALLNALMPVGNEILKILVPVVLKLVNVLITSLGPVMRGLAPVMKPIAETVAALGDAFGIVIKAVVPLLIPLLKIVGAFNAIDTPIERVALLIGRLVQAAAPLIAIVVKIATMLAGDLAAALIGVVSALMPLIPPIIKLADMLGGVLLQAIQILMPPILALLPPLSTLANAVLTALLAIITPLLPVIVQLATVIAQVLTAVAPLITTIALLITTISPILGLLMKLVAFIVGELIGGLGKLLVVLVNLVTKGIDYLVKGIKYLITNWRQLLSDVEDVARKVWNAVLTAFTDVINFFRHVGTDIINAFKAAGSWLLKAGKSIIHGLWTGIQNMFLTVTHFFLHVGGTIVNWLRDAESWLLHVGEDIIHGLWNGITGAIGWLGRQVKSIGSHVLGFFKSVFHIGSPSKDMADQIGAPLMQGIAQGLTGNTAETTKAIKAVQESIAQEFAAMRSSLNMAGTFLHADATTVGAQIMSGIQVGLENEFASVLSTVNTESIQIQEAFAGAMQIASPSRVMADRIGRPMMQGLAKGLRDNIGLVTSAARDVSGRMSGFQWGGVTAPAMEPHYEMTVVLDLHDNQVMTDRDMDTLVDKMGRALSTRVLPQGGLRLQ